MKWELLLALVLLGPAFSGCLGGPNEGESGPSMTFPACGGPADVDDGGGMQGTAEDQTLPVGYASEPGRVLIRWFANASAGEPYTVTRQGPGGETQEWTVEPATEASQARRILDATDPRWTNLTDALMAELSPMGFSGSDAGDLVDFLLEEDALGQMLASRFYPVALATGTGFLDEGAQAGVNYTYTVEDADNASKTGNATVLAGQRTPLSAPTAFDCVELGPGSDLRAPDEAGWSEQQRDRRFDRRVLLRWNASHEPIDASAWRTGYDVWRAPLPEGGVSALSELDFEHRNGELPVQPTPTRPPMHNVTRAANASGNATVEHQPIDFYHSDKTPTSGDWVYIIAPRDLLGHVPTPGEDEGPFSQPIKATSYDLEPPESPRNLTARANDSAKRVHLTWTHPAVSSPASARQGQPSPGQRVDRSIRESGAPSTDPVDHFEIYRALHSPTPGASDAQVNLSRGLGQGTSPGSGLGGSADVRAVTERPSPDPCQDRSDCWTHVTNVSGLSWTDNESTVQEDRWYKVVAVDANGNPSAAAGPEHARINDTEPPPKPSIEAASQAPPLRAKRTPGAGAASEEGVLEVTPRGDANETARLRVYCQFQPNGTWIRMTEVDTARAPEVGDGYEVLLNDVYEPPRPTRASCKARAVDPHGNPSNATDPVLVGPYGGLNDAPVPTPILTRVEKTATILKTAVEIEWSMPDRAGVSGFTVRRTNSTGALETFRIGPDRDSFVDDTVETDERYTYQVLAHHPKGDTESPNRTLSLTLGGGTGQVGTAERPAHRLTWSSIEWKDADFQQGTFRKEARTHLEWTCGHCNDTGQFAVFRSPAKEGGWHQITPVLELQQAEYEEPVKGSDEVRVFTEPFSYTDPVAFDDRWYQVVQFANDTGEPIAATEPRRPANHDIDRDRNIDWGNHTLEEPGSVWAADCEGTAPDANRPLVFADGFEVEVDRWTKQDPGDLQGEGTLMLGEGDDERRVSVDFDGLSVEDGQNTVCEGSLTVELDPPLEVSRENGLDYTLHSLTLNPEGSQTFADVAVRMPETLTYAEPRNTPHLRLVDGQPQPILNESRWMPLEHARLQGDLSFSFHLNLTRLAHGCQSPVVELHARTMPVRFVPQGTLNVTPSGIEAEGACMRYEDPYDPEGGDDGWPDPSQATRGGANDGFLRANYTAKSSVTIDADGLAGDFQTDREESPLEWVASRPYGFSVRASQHTSLHERLAELSLDETRIAEGAIGPGKRAGVSVTFKHAKGLDGATKSFAKEGNAGNLTVEENGVLTGTVDDLYSVYWRQFSVEPPEWTLALGNTTWEAPPFQAMRSPVPGHQQTLSTVGETRLEHGLNLRTEETKLKWTCSAHALELDTAVDAYLRHGGMSDRFVAKLEGQPAEMDLHGYDATLRTLALSFLDNRVVDQDTALDLDLPFPTNVTLTLDELGLDEDGCIDNGRVAGDETTFDHWNLSARLDAVDFRKLPGGIDHRGDRLLWAHGGFELPRLNHSQNPDEPAILDAEIGLMPDGSLAETALQYNETTVTVDGHDFLLEGLRLSDVGETPGWSPDATLEDPPTREASFWDSHGFVEYEGRLSTPYFGLLEDPTGDAPRLRVSSDLDYLGFDEQPKVEKVWLDKPQLQVVFDYNMTYVQGEGKQGLFAGFESYSFVPLGKLVHELEQAEGRLLGEMKGLETQLEENVTRLRRDLEDNRTRFEKQRQTALDRARKAISKGMALSRDNIKTTVNQRLAPIFDQLNTTTGYDRNSLTTAQAFLKIAKIGLAEKAAPLKDNASRLSKAKTEHIDPAYRGLEEVHANVTNLSERVDRAATIARTVETSLSISLGLLETAQLQTAKIGEGDRREGVKDLRKLLRQLRGAANHIQTIDTEVQRLEANVSQAVGEADKAVQSVETANQTLHRVAEQLTSEIPSKLDGMEPGTEAKAVEATDPEERKKKFRDISQKYWDQLNATNQTLHDAIDKLFDDVKPSLLDAFNRTRDNITEHVRDAFDNANETLDRTEKLRKDHMVPIRKQLDTVATDLVGTIRQSLEPFRVVFLDTAAIAKPHKVETFLGLSSGTAALRALAETKRATGENPPDELDSWGEKIGIPIDDPARADRPYDQLTRDVWDEFEQGGYSYSETTALLDSRAEQGNDNLPHQQGYGGGTGGALADLGLRILRVRGDVHVQDTPDDWRFHEFRMSHQLVLGRDAVQVDLPGPREEPWFEAEIIDFRINRFGAFELAGRDMQGGLLANDLTLDATLLINTSLPRFEGGVTLHDLNARAVYMDETDGGVGVGPRLFYLGATFDGAFGGSNGVRVGGAFLIGEIDPTSRVLTDHFETVIEHLDEVPRADETATLSGLYIRAYGDIPVVPNLGCLLRISIGGRVAVWYFEGQGGEVGGGLLAGHATGKVICLVSARGQLALQYAQSQQMRRFEGTGWIAGGLGFCSPDTWKDWSKRWWDDDWCQSAGAMFTVTYEDRVGDSKPGTWTADPSVDSEGL